MYILNTQLVLGWCPYSVLCF